MTTQQQAERRRRDVAGRIARATWPLRESYKQFLSDLGDLPCRLIGHRWVEVPPSHVSARARASGRMRFRCARCFLMGGFSN